MVFFFNGGGVFGVIGSNAELGDIVACFISNDFILISIILGAKPAAAIFSTVSNFVGWKIVIGIVDGWLGSKPSCLTYSVKFVPVSCVLSLSIVVLMNFCNISSVDLFLKSSVFCFWASCAAIFASKLSLCFCQSDCAF